QGGAGEEAATAGPRQQILADPLGHAHASGHPAELSFATRSRQSIAPLLAHSARPMLLLRLRLLSTACSLACPPMLPLVVLPTLNEADTVVEVLQRVRQAVPDAAVLVVDDGSPDGTAQLAQEAADRLGEVTVLRRDGKRGLGDAYRAGFRWGLDRGFGALV